ncbi:MAG TPA: DUF1360 domain-containing protein [Pseudacidobacterium sp.]|jgi:hypothetical protein|nr:DUF1360 domain-containing protein [Pseudacidobacterium sp.]
MNAETWFRFITSALAVWRLTHLLSAEDGPREIVARIRRMLGNTIFGKLMDCFYCLSLWISIPFAFFVGNGVPKRFVVWLALSGAASLANKLGQEPIVIEPLDHHNN